MKLLIRQRVFSWTDSYDVYDENENPKYFVKAEFFSLTHQLHVYDRNQAEIGVVRQQLFQFLPQFVVERNGQIIGKIQKKLTFFKPEYRVDFMGWQVEGDFWGWNYNVYQGNSKIMNITKELFHWGDTYVIEFADPADEVMGLLLVIAIDAANCSQD